MTNEPVDLDMIYAKIRDLTRKGRDALAKADSRHHIVYYSPPQIPIHVQILDIWDAIFYEICHLVVFVIKLCLTALIALSVLALLFAITATLNIILLILHPWRHICPRRQQ